MGYENHPWYLWVTEGPKLGYEVTPMVEWGPCGYEDALKIKGALDDTCSGIFRVSELRANGWGNSHVASIQALAKIVNKRKNPTDR